MKSFAYYVSNPIRKLQKNLDNIINTICNMEETMFSKEVERERERVERVNSNLNIIRLTHTYPKNEFGFNNNPNHHFDLMYSNHSGGR